MFGLFLGDLGYDDPQPEEVTRYLWHTSPAQPRFSRFVRECPTLYTYDQHDFCGNGSWSGSANAAVAHRYAREYPATYPLPATGLYCTWRIGRYRFVQLDTRTLRSDPALPDGSDKTYIAGIPGLAGRMVWLSADMHTLAADDGSHSPNGSVQLVGAALGQTGFEGVGGLYFNPGSWNRGWRIAADGAYGPRSESVCRSFQAEKGLAVDGIVGPATWRAAWEAPIT
ncbi:peptidoglycan-binding protein [Actinomadura sp. NAK00032]|nr:peptidoglycan-binding protein [Actinomadura sp. NAK00032]